MTSFPMFIGPFEIITVLSIYLIFLFSALYLIKKHEKGLAYFIWLLVIICLPLMGPIAYFLKNIATSRTPETFMEG